MSFAPFRLSLLLAVAVLATAFSTAGWPQEARESWKTCGDGYRACMLFCAERRGDAPECRIDCDRRLAGAPTSCLETGKFRWPVDKPAYGPLEKTREAGG